MHMPDKLSSPEPNRVVFLIGGGGGIGFVGVNVNLVCQVGPLYNW